MSGINANTHLVNAIVAIIDFCISGVPVNTLHFIYPMIFAAAYALVNGLYYAGTQTPVYPVTDYGKDLGLAIGVSLASVFVLFPFIHLVFYFGLHKLKVLIMFCLFHSSSEETQEVEMKEEQDEGNHPEV